jgi:glycosyltransferase involved in cell wall biosynthesis
MNIVQGTVVWKDPIVIYSAQFESPRSAMAAVGETLRDREVIFLVLVAWSASSPESARSLAELSRKYRSEQPNHTIVHMCNTLEEVEVLRSLGENAEWFNHNLFVDPGLYKIVPGRVKTFDAFYNATLQRWKRHSLASNIRSLALAYHSYSADQEPYRQELISAMPTAVFANHANGGNGRFLPKNEVLDLLAISKVGLCLSEVEGAMHASIEYLLAGLPVVSTINKGGRDEFFGAAYTRTVAADARDVAAACQDLISKGLEGEDIRNATIARQRSGLQRFWGFVDRLLAERGQNSRIEGSWPQIYQDKLLGWEPVDSFLSRLA